MNWKRRDVRIVMKSGLVYIDTEGCSLRMIEGRGGGLELRS